MADVMNFLPAAADIAPTAVGEGMSAGFGPAAAAGGGGDFASALPGFAGGAEQAFNLGAYMPSMGVGDITPGAAAGGGAPPIPGGVPGAAPATPTVPAGIPAGTTAAGAASVLPSISDDPFSVVTPAQASTINTLSGGPVPAGGGAGVGGPFDFLSKNVLGPIKQSGIGELLGVGVPAAGLIKQLASMSGGQTPLSPLQQEQLNAMRAQRGQAEQFMTGAVTPQMEQNFQNQTKAEIQQIKARYAQMGMSGSTAEMQDIAAAQARGTARLGQAQGQMIATGASMLGLPAGYMQKISNEQLAQDAAFSDALARFVASIAGSPPAKTP